MKIYFAGPLFTLAERIFNEDLAYELKNMSPLIKIDLPQQHALNIADKADFSSNMFDYCISAIDDADVLVAILDGADSDSGTCIEIGYAKGKGKPIIGIRTDFRNSEDRGLNLMVANICSHLIIEKSTEITIQIIAWKILQYLEKIRLDSTLENHNIAS